MAESEISDEFWGKSTGLSVRQKYRAIRGLREKSECLKIQGRGKMARFSVIETALESYAQEEIASGTFSKARTAGRTPDKVKSKTHPDCQKSGCQALDVSESVLTRVSQAPSPSISANAISVTTGSSDFRRPCHDEMTGVSPPAVPILIKKENSLKKETQSVSSLVRETKVTHSQTLGSLSSNGQKIPVTNRDLAKTPREYQVDSKRLVRIKEIVESTLGVKMGGLVCPPSLLNEISDSLPTASLDHFQALCQAKREQSYPVTGYRLALNICEDAEQPGAENIFLAGQRDSTTSREKVTYDQRVAEKMRGRKA